LFIFNTFGWNLVASALIFLSIVFDGCDGEMARFLECSSGFAGAYNEPVSHDVEYGLMFIPITLGLHFSGFSVWYVFAGFLASIFKLMERSHAFVFSFLDLLLLILRKTVNNLKRHIIKSLGIFGWYIG